MTEIFGFECKAITKTAKNGKEYICLDIIFPNGYKKLVFLDSAETFMLIEMLKERG